MKKFLSRLVIIATPLVLGSFGSIVTSADSSWYMSLAKPPFNPPGWVFGPVWVFLYLLMGIALFLVFESESSFKKKAIKVFWIQFALNVMWSFAFFGLESAILGLLVIFFLWVAIIFTIYQFFRVCRTSGWLLVPYFLWVTFAMFLNFSIFSLN